MILDAEKEDDYWERPKANKSKLRSGYGPDLATVKRRQRRQERRAERKRRLATKAASGGKTKAKAKAKKLVELWAPYTK